MKRTLQILLVLIASIQLSAQERTISGVVTSSSDKLPIPGVNVVIKGTSTGAQTNFDGYYEIKANEEQILVFSFIGMM